MQKLASNIIATSTTKQLVKIAMIVRDQPNSRFHGRDIFREIDRLP